ncbi:MAG TPA: glycosyltransferase family 2 protein [Thermoleophilaceae bacterium]|nr:glycosyltransferase family 2 protein [Thermoleophilaceae bacterium]
MTAVVIPNWNGARWLPGCLDSLAAEPLQPSEVIVVDNGSTDGSLELLRERGVRVIELGRNTGFAFAANRGLEAASADYVALVNTDVELAPDWLARMAAALDAAPEAASVASKMLDLADRTRVYDAGDILRRDGVCEQRGRFGPDDGRYDQPEEMFAACAGAALYRREAVLDVGGFDERFFAYLEDVDLGLRLRLAGWTCRYEPAVAYHASEGSSGALERPLEAWVERNTLLLVAKTFPLRWLPYVTYRQLGWGWHALRERRLRKHLGGALAALPVLPAMLRERRALRASAKVNVEDAVPKRPIRGRRGARTG